MKLKFMMMTAMLCSSVAASAADGYKYAMPTETSRHGEAQCGRMANMDVDIYYENWMRSGKGAQFPLAKAKETYGAHSGMDTDAMHNALVEAHLGKVWAGKYKSKEESTTDFYGQCMDSPFRKYLDKKWTKK